MLLESSTEVRPQRVFKGKLESSGSAYLRFFFLQVPMPCSTWRYHQPWQLDQASVMCTANTLFRLYLLVLSQLLAALILLLRMQIPFFFISF